MKRETFNPTFVKPNESYYTQQLNQVKPGATEYAPTIKIFANGNGLDTKHLTLNKESAADLIAWLQKNY